MRLCDKLSNGSTLDFHALETRKELGVQIQQAPTLWAHTALLLGIGGSSTCSARVSAGTLDSEKVTRALLAADRSMATDARYGGSTSASMQTALGLRSAVRAYPRRCHRQVAFGCDTSALSGAAASEVRPGHGVYYVAKVFKPGMTTPHERLFAGREREFSVVGTGQLWRRRGRRCSRRNSARRSR